MRRDSKLTQEGAEKYVLSNLLIRDIECYQAYENQRSYDLIAISKDGKKTARIEVKSRHNDYAKKITSSNFQQKKPPFPDFYVSIFIESFEKNEKKPINIQKIIVMVLPQRIVHSKENTNVGKKGEYFYPNKLKNYEIYLDNYQLIDDFLNN